MIMEESLCAFIQNRKIEQKIEEKKWGNCFRWEKLALTFLMKWLYI